MIFPPPCHRRADGVAQSRCSVPAIPLRTEIDKGVSGPNVASVQFYFDSMDAFQGALGKPETAEVMADVANYTNIEPVMQVSEIVD